MHARPRVFTPRRARRAALGALALGALTACQKSPENVHSWQGAQEKRSMDTQKTPEPAQGEFSEKSGVEFTTRRPLERMRMESDR